MMPPNDAKAVAVHLVVDKYIEDSSKSGARKIRSESNSIRLNITVVGQATSSTTNELYLALSNTITKKSIHCLLVNLYPTIINGDDNTRMTEPSSGNVTELFVYNHIEANTCNDSPCLTSRNKKCSDSC